MKRIPGISLLLSRDGIKDIKVLPLRGQTTKTWRLCLELLPYVLALDAMLRETAQEE